MKKAVISVCILAALFFLAACTDNTPVQSVENNKTSEKVVTEGSNFTVTEIKNKDGIIKYSYEVTDSKGEIIEQALCAELPRVAQVNEKLIGIRFTTENHFFVRYYDVERGLISPSFKNAFWGNDTLVARHDYDNGHYFVVQNIFDKNEYCVKTEVDCDSWQMTVVSAEENADGTALLVKYVPGDGGDPKMRTYSITLSIDDKQQ